MSERQRTIDNHLAALDAFEALVSELSSDDWGVQSLCPDWTVHGVVAHIAAIEHVLSGWFPASAEDPPPFAKAGEFMLESESLSGPELAARMSEIFASRRTELSALTNEQFDTPSLTPVGLQTYGRFMAIRIFDIWIHEQDIRTPLGKPGHEGGAVAEQALEEIAGSLGFIVGKKIGAEEGQSLAIELTGPVNTTLFAKVEGRAKPVDHVDNPTATLTTDSLTFCQLACGRIDPETQISDGRVSWSGDDDLGGRAARNLRFTM